MPPCALPEQPQGSEKFKSPARGPLRSDRVSSIALFAVVLIATGAVRRSGPCRRRSTPSLDSSTGSGRLASSWPGGVGSGPDSGVRQIQLGCAAGNLQRYDRPMLTCHLRRDDARLGGVRPCAAYGCGTQAGRLRLGLPYVCRWLWRLNDLSASSAGVALALCFQKQSQPSTGDGVAGSTPSPISLGSSSCRRSSVGNLTHHTGNPLCQAPPRPQSPAFAAEGFQLLFWCARRRSW